MQRNFFSVHEYQGPSYRLADGSCSSEQYGNYPRQSGNCTDFGADSGGSGASMFPAMSIRRKPLPVWVAVLDQAAAWLDPTVGDKTIVLDDARTGILWPAFRYGRL